MIPASPRRTRRARPAQPHWIILALPALFLALAWMACEDAGNLDPLLPQIESGAVVAGSVHDIDGVPASRAVVTLEAWENGLPLRIQRLLAGDSRMEWAVGRDPLRVTTTDAHGRFVFSGVGSGEYALAAEARDHLGATRRVSVSPQDVSSPQDTVFVDIDLTPTGTFLGAALLENATHHQSTVVYVDGTSYVAVTDPEGDFSLTGVPVGTWVVRATHAGYLDESTLGTLAAAGDSVTLPAVELVLDSNIPPVAVANAPVNPRAEEVTQLTGSGSDVDGTVVLYEWDFEDDGTFDSSSGVSATAAHIYPAAGPVRAKLRVTDDRGAIGLSAVSFTVLPPATVFVSATTGQPGNPGTQEDPVATIADGIALAVVSGGPVKIAAGTYNESITLVAGLELLGGYDPVTWQRDIPNFETRIVGGQKAVTGIAQNNVLLEGLRIESADAVAPGGGSYGVFLRGCSAFRMRDCSIAAGAGAAGAASGTNGVPGVNGGNGAMGTPGCENSTTFCEACSQPQGGAGGTSPFWQGQTRNGGIGGAGGLGPDNGVAGGPGSGPSPGSGGPGGTCVAVVPCGTACANGQTGQAGADGTNGADGAGGTDFGNYDAAGHVPANGSAGADGAPGSGGGGGGGGHGGTANCDSYGSSGGGGGGGATPGTLATGGSGGGGSFGVWLDLCLGAEIANCAISTGGGGAGRNGGTGGAGGAGGNGGPGGPYGGSEQDDAGCGGAGGPGGDGGRGGHGGGGGGGPSMGIFALPSGVSVTNVTFDLGPAGAGGASSGNAGATGRQMNVGP